MSATTDRLPAGALAMPGRADAVPPAALAMRAVSGAEWDAAVTGFDGVCQEQLHVFAANRWPGVALEPWLFLENGEVVGGTMVMIQPLPLRLGAIAVCKWGPLHKDENRVDRAAVYAGMIEALTAEYADRRGQTLSILPRASLTSRNEEFEHLSKRGFHKGSVLAFPSRYIVKLRLSDAEQRGSFAQKWRYHLNKAEKAGLSFEHAGPERLPEFDALYHAMTDRKQFADHSAYDTVPALMAIEDPALRPELFFVRHEGTVVAGAIIFKTGLRAVYLYGATNDAALPLRAGYFLHWHIIRWLRDNTRAEWYDLGGTDGYQGLHQFKKGMVGEAGVIEPVPPVGNYASRPVAYLLGIGAFAARDFVHAAQRYVAGLIDPRKRPTQARPGSEAGQ